MRYLILKFILIAAGSQSDSVEADLKKEKGSANTEKELKIMRKKLGEAVDKIRLLENQLRDLKVKHLMEIREKQNIIEEYDLNLEKAKEKFEASAFSNQQKMNQWKRLQKQKCRRYVKKLDNRIENMK